MTGSSSTHQVSVTLQLAERSDSVRLPACLYPPTRLLLSVSLLSSACSCVLLTSLLPNLFLLWETGGALQRLSLALTASTISLMLPGDPWSGPHWESRAMLVEMALEHLSGVLNILRFHANTGETWP